MCISGRFFGHDVKFWVKSSYPKRFFGLRMSYSQFFKIWLWATLGLIVTASVLYGTGEALNLGSTREVLAGASFVFVGLTPFMFLGWLVDTPNRRHRKRIAQALQLAERIGAQRALDEIGVSEFGHSVVGVRRSDNVLLLSSGPSLQEYPISAVTSVEVLRDNHSVAGGDTRSVVGGALIGAMMFGGVGALVGALAGSAGNKKTQSLHLKITLDDPDPVRKIELFRARHGGATPDDKELLAAVRKIDRLDAHLTAMIQKAVKAEERPADTSIRPDTIAELERLWGLKTAGAIDEREYLREKAALLGSA